MTHGPELTTQRLRLRRWRSADRAPFALLNADPHVVEHFPAAWSRAGSDDFVDHVERHFEEHGFGFWAVERRDSGEFIGFVGLGRPRFPAHFMPCVEIGWRLAREHWGRGFATEGARACLRFGFTRLDLEEIVAFTVPANVRSIRVMEKLGMSRDPADDFEHPRLPEGHHLRPHVLYRLSRADWEAMSPGR